MSEQKENTKEKETLTSRFINFLGWTISWTIVALLLMVILGLLIDEDTTSGICESFISDYGTELCQYEDLLGINYTLYGVSPTEIQVRSGFNDWRFEGSDMIRHSYSLDYLKNVVLSNRESLPVLYKRLEEHEKADSVDTSELKLYISYIEGDIVSAQEKIDNYGDTIFTQERINEFMSSFISQKNQEHLVKEKQKEVDRLRKIRNDEILEGLKCD